MSEKETPDQNTDHLSTKDAEREPGRLRRFVRSLGRKADELLSLSSEADKSPEAETPEQAKHFKMLAIQDEVYDATILEQPGQQHIADLTKVLPQGDGDIAIISSQGGELMAGSGKFNRHYRVIRRVGPSLETYMVTEPAGSVSSTGEPQPLRASRYSDYEALFDTTDGTATLTDVRGVFLEKSGRESEHLDVSAGDLTVDDITGGDSEERQRYTGEVERILDAVRDSVTEEFRREKGI